MKPQLTFYLIFIGVSLLIEPTKGQTITEHNIARVSKVNNKLVFLFSEPIGEYDVVFTFENNIPNYLCANPSQVVIASISNANQESGNQNKLYDAIIVSNGSPRDMAIVWKHKEQDNSLARVKTIEARPVFVECEPIGGYEVLGKYVLKKCVGMQRSIDQLIKKSRKEKGDRVAVFYGSTKYDLVIRLKE